MSELRAAKVALLHGWPGEQNLPQPLMAPPPLLTACSNPYQAEINSAMQTLADTCKLRRAHSKHSLSTMNQRADRTGGGERRESKLAVCLQLINTFLEPFVLQRLRLEFSAATVEMGQQLVQRSNSALSIGRLGKHSYVHLTPAPATIHHCEGTGHCGPPAVPSLSFAGWPRA